MKLPKKKTELAPQAVLILDKDAGMLKLVKNYIETLGTREIVTVTEADEAWERLTTQPFDVVIMDWKMKAPGGLAMYERIRSDERMEILPIILISGFVTKDDITIAKMDPNSRFLVKPFTEEILLAIIKRAHSNGVAEREKHVANGRAVVQPVKDIATQAVEDLTAGGKTDLGLMVQKGQGQGTDWTTTQERQDTSTGPNVRFARGQQPSGEFEIRVEKPVVGGNMDHKLAAHKSLNDNEIRRQRHLANGDMEIRQERNQTTGEFSKRTSKDPPTVTGQDMKITVNNHIQDMDIRQQRPQSTASGGDAKQVAAPQGTKFELRQSGHNIASVAGLQQTPPGMPGLDDMVFADDTSSIEDDLNQTLDNEGAAAAAVGVADQPIEVVPAPAELPAAPPPDINYFDNPPKAVDPIKAIPERVLIIDSDLAAVQMIENYMRAIGTKECDKFTNGRDAWEAIRNKEYDLIVMDWKQKGMSGLCLYNRIRSERRSVRVPVIVTSGFVHKEDFRLLDESSYTNFLEKPFSMGVFGKALNETIQESSGHTRTLNKIVELLTKALAEKRDVVTVIKGILREVPNAHQFVTAAGQFFFAKGMLVEAEKTLKIAHKLQPDSVAIMSELGKVYHRANRPQEAYTILKKANKFSPGAIERLCLLGEVGLNLSNTDEARKYFKEALQIDDEHVVANAGVTVANNLAEHIKDQGHSQSVTAKFASSLNIIGITFVRNQMATRGIEQYRAAMCFVHDQGVLAKVHFNLGMAYLRSKSLEDAEKWFESAAKLADVDFTKASVFADRVKAMRGGVVKPTLLGESGMLGYAEEAEEDIDVGLKVG